MTAVRSASGGVVRTRIAVYNVQNLFVRPKALDRLNWNKGRRILDAYGEVNALFQEATYSEADRERMRELLVELDIYTRNEHGAIRRKYSRNPQWAWLRKNRGHFDSQPQDETRNVEIKAEGRGDWIGWVELAKEQANETSTRLTGRVIEDVDADILGVVEAEDRPSLVRFNEEMLGNRYTYVMLIDGNDRRGIDVGLMTREGFALERMRSNVDWEDRKGEVFDRDCPQYEVRTKSGNLVHVLVNHFKSQSGGGGPKRYRQAMAVRDIARKLADDGQHVVVAGDLNEGPATTSGQAANLAPLYGDESPLIDCYSLPEFDTGPRPGTFDSCGIRNRLDYIFVSRSLKDAFVSGGVFRKGLWGKGRKRRPRDWTTYEAMTGSQDQASDHAAVYVDLNL